MTFLKVRIAGLGLLLCGVAVGAQEQDLTKVQIKVTKVAGSVYMLEGSDGARSLEKVFRIHHRRCFPRNPVRFAYRTENSEVHQA
jgi:hypothetical protein